MGLTEGVGMDTLVTIILADALICTSLTPLPICLLKQQRERGGPFRVALASTRTKGLSA